MEHSVDEISSESDLALAVRVSILRHNALHRQMQLREAMHQLPQQRSVHAKLVAKEPNLELSEMWQARRAN